jgi:hypothetical protein
MLELTAVAVVARFTLYETLELWSGRKSGVPGVKTAWRFRVPTAVGVKEHFPAVTGAVQLPAFPYVMVTLPTGVPAPGASTETENSTVIACPKKDAAGALVIETVVAAAPTS